MSDGNFLQWFLWVRLKNWKWILLYCGTNGLIKQTPIFTYKLHGNTEIKYKELKDSVYQSLYPKKLKVNVNIYYNFSGSVFFIVKYHSTKQLY